MTTLVVNGRRPVSGSYTPTGNKNAALPALAACLLTAEPVTLRNIPLIKDVEVMLELLASLGVTVERHDRTVTLCARQVAPVKLDRDLCRRVRASILLAGPLVARCGRAEFYPPGGDVIGRRRLDTHFAGLQALGVTVKTADTILLRGRKLRGADLLLDEASVTATENLIMAAALADGTTTIYHAACEPHVQDLCRLLIAMGARIEGVGTNRLVVHGAKKLGGAEFTIGPDYIEIGSFMAAALVTGGELTIEGVVADQSLEVVRRAFTKLGARWTPRANGSIHLPARKRLRVAPDFGAAIPKIEDGIWPAFPSDLMSVAIVLATQAQGGVLFFEKLFESRMFFVDRLIEMGARIVLCDPHRVLVQGPARLHGIHMTSPDIRAGMSMLIAALCAKGSSVIDNAEVIDRGYEAIDERLRALGADIERR
ncbi:MAG TPA: UDP-N-acetylglucosamine 1-carboxyvinyltransferase [Kiritimatiellia bacterium]|nr:UDP-N-acetylglucosamine 1-carboxyvinyltransferase [Kiritimatiellia bacterium]HMP33943.1 UDP-N-acetylglucosamine 1-carboxyvinyltransferase [Kiritimatiellia bacterium]